MPFIPSTTSRSEGIAAPGKGVSIAPATGGNVDSQIERSTYLIAQRLGCSPQAIQKLAGITPSSTNNYALSSLANSSRHGGPSSTKRSPQKSSSSASPSPPNSSRNNNTSNNQMMSSVKKEIDDIKPMSLPPLPQHLQQHGTSSNQNNNNNKRHGIPNKTAHSPQENHGTGGLTIAQQQAAFLDDAEAARQFAAQLRFRDAMLQQRKGPSVGQYEIPSVIGSDAYSNVYSRAPHVSMDSQTPRSSRFMFNVDLFENGAKRPGPGEYFTSGGNGGSTLSARGKSIGGGRDRGMRKKLAIERINPRMPLSPPKKKKQEHNQYF